MFKKVIISEDLDPINIAVVQALETLSIPEIQFSKYCDDTYLKIKKAPHFLGYQYQTLY